MIPSNLSATGISKINLYITILQLFVLFFCYAEDAFNIVIYLPHIYLVEIIGANDF